MRIIEQAIIPKNPRQKCEDGLVVTPHFIAVIDGSTSKSNVRHSLFRTNGRYCMQLVARYIRKAPKTISCQQFCQEVTSYVRRHYRTSLLPLLTRQPEERMAASAVIFSRVRREVWIIGDCQCIIGGQHYDNPKPYEQQLAQQRADIIRNMTPPGPHAATALQPLLQHDTARQQILPLMKQYMQRQNIDYAVIDGFPIPIQHVRIITLNFQPWEIILASDGYPFLRNTLQESEQLLQYQRTHDPLNIQDFKATKAFMIGNNSFDDRTYIRFQV